MVNNVLLLQMMLACGPIVRHFNSVSHVVLAVKFKPSVPFLVATIQ